MAGRHPTRLLAVAVAAVLLVSACGTGQGGSTGTPTAADPLAAAGLEPGTSWVLTSFEWDDAEVELLAGSPITLARSDQGIEGSSGCNQYGADGQQLAGDGDRLFPPVYVTEMACMDAGVMEVEAAYLDALADVTTAEAADGMLVLAGDRAVLRFDRAE